MVLVTNRICSTYPEFIIENSEYAVRLLYLLPRLVGSFKSDCLEAISAVAIKIPGIFLDLKTKNLLGCLRHNDVESQTYTILILISVLPILMETDVLFFIDILLGMGPSYSAVRLRQVFYLFTAKLLDICREKNWKILSRVEKILINGLADIDEEIRSELMKYFETKNIVQQGVRPRIDISLR